MRRYKFQTAVGAYEDTTVTLSDADTVYTEVRHMHMREAIDKLIRDFNDFLKEHAGFKGCARWPAGLFFCPADRLHCAETVLQV
jgi:hypothetical protein